MYISELFDQKKAVISFEIFPPKQTSSIVTIYETIDALAPLRPDYISVTYGAGGSTSKTTLEIASIIKNKYRINALAHLTCFNSSREDIDKMLTDLEKENIANVLALRGDRPRTWKAGEEKESDFKYAADLAKFISSKHKFCLGGACYPEGHPECSDLDRDVENLKRKEEAGVDFLITQLFFDNEKYYRFKEKADKSGIKIPIQAGIMPITNRKQVERMIELSNATIPHKLVRILDKFEHNQQAIRDAGIAYATEQIIELLANEIRGIHIYTMNKPQIAKDLVRNLDSILYALNN
ncbi:MAG: methylenetetrahydrofolate reductase [NAD(P)H] [Peptococcaceae bacterium]|nr:methylenetetrahydrofolate reductase [NAD(P)H] [Peptococcaceae bacterium]